MLSNETRTRSPVTAGPLRRGAMLAFSSSTVEQVTQNFFLEGERHEATQWQYAHLPIDDEEGPSDQSVGFESFSKIPRNTRPLKAVIALGGLAVAAYAFIPMAFDANSHAAALFHRSSTEAGAPAPVASADRLRNSPETSVSRALPRTEPMAPSAASVTAGHGSAIPSSAIPKSVLKTTSNRNGRKDVRPRFQTIELVDNNAHNSGNAGKIGPVADQVQVVPPATIDSRPANREDTDRQILPLDLEASDSVEHAAVGITSNTQPEPQDPDENPKEQARDRPQSQDRPQARERPQDRPQDSDREPAVSPDNSSPGTSSSSP
jgi:hypothetical protein